jgi:hypothetical protein
MLRPMYVVRLVAAFVAGAAPSAFLVLTARDTCSATDVFLVAMMALVLGVPVGAVAGVVGAVIAPRGDGWAGFGATALGVPIGVMAAMAAIGAQGSGGAALALFVPPMLIPLSIAFGVTRWLARHVAPVAAPPVPTGPSAPDRTA